MPLLSVVAREIRRERRSAPARAGIGAAICPFREQRADEALGLAVCPRTVRPRAAGGDAEGVRRCQERHGAIAAAVVGEQALERDPEGRLPRGGTREEGRRRRGGLVGKHLAVGQPRVIVDRHVHASPPDTAHARALVPMHPVSDPADAADLFDVQVHELPGAVQLVAHEAARGAGAGPGGADAGRGGATSACAVRARAAAICRSSAAGAR